MTIVAAPAARPRRRDSTRSRELLLAAGRELFAERGFDRTTLREIGERAGLDAALIARYFASKTGLYIAALRAEDTAEVPPDLLQAGRMESLLERLHRRGPGPIFQAAVRPDDDPTVQSAAREELHRRLVAPLRDRLEHATRSRRPAQAEAPAQADPPAQVEAPGRPEAPARPEAPPVDSQLRAEVAVAAFAGIALGRTSGAFPALAEVDLPELVALATRLLTSLEDLP